MAKAVLLFIFCIAQLAQTLGSAPKGAVPFWQEATTSDPLPFLQEDTITMNASLSYP